MCHCRGIAPSRLGAGSRAARRGPRSGHWNGPANRRSELAVRPRSKDAQSTHGRSDPKLSSPQRPGGARGKAGIRLARGPETGATAAPAPAAHERPKARLGALSPCRAFSFPRSGRPVSNRRPSAWEHGRPTPRSGGIRRPNKGSCPNLAHRPHPPYAGLARPIAHTIALTRPRQPGGLKVAWHEGVGGLPTPPRRPGGTRRRGLRSAPSGGPSASDADGRGPETRSTLGLSAPLCALRVLIHALEAAPVRPPHCPVEVR